MGLGLGLGLGLGDELDKAPAGDGDGGGNFLEDDFESYPDPTAVPSTELKADWKVNDETESTITDGELISAWATGTTNMALSTETLKDGGGDFFLECDIHLEGSGTLARVPWNIGFRRDVNTATAAGSGGTVAYELRATTSVDLAKRNTGGGQLVSDVDFGITHGDKKTVRIEVTHETTNVRIKVWVDADQVINVLDNGTVAGAAIQTEGYISFIFRSVTEVGNSSAIDNVVFGAL